MKSDMKNNIAILLTVFNRKDVTLAGLQSLFDIIRDMPEYNFAVFMTDDGSQDGTSEVVASYFPTVTIIEGDGNLFWCGGMNKAWEVATKIKEYDYYIWYNDDAIVFPTALSSLFEVISEKGVNNIVCGAFKDEVGNTSYSGLDVSGKRVSPNGSIQELYKMNGNLVLIPQNVFKKVGFIHNKIRHGCGDFEYGLRAQKMSFKVLLTKDYVGVTNRHDDPIPAFFNPKYSIIQRFRILYSPKNSPIDKWYASYPYDGIFKAMYTFLWYNVVTLFAKCYLIIHNRKHEYHSC